MLTPEQRLMVRDLVNMIGHAHREAHDVWQHLAEAMLAWDWEHSTSVEDTRRRLDLANRVYFVSRMAGEAGDLANRLLAVLDAPGTSTLAAG